MRKLFARAITLRMGLIAIIAFATTLSVSAQEKPLQVFVLVGQSNMQGHARVRTLEHLSMDPESKSILSEIQSDDGKPIVHKDIWISYLSAGGVKQGQLSTGFGADENKIGPELTFGIYMQKKIKQPILIIKTAWGGKSINTDFRSPSAGPYEFAPSVLERLEKQGKDLQQVKADKAKATGVYYRKTVEHVKSVLKDIKSVYPDYKPSQGFELAGMVWFQGWNDMVDGGTYPNRGGEDGYAAYSKVLNHMIRDFRKDLSAPKMPFVIGVMGVDGPTAKYTPNKKRYQKIHQNFRDAMAAPAKREEFQENVFVVLTEKYWDMELESVMTRDRELKNKLKKIPTEGKLDRKGREAKLQEFRDAEFSEREKKILEVGPSNAAYHYLGSGKIMAGIGKGFAEAIPVGK